MRTFKKSSTAIITTLALGLLPALPAAAQPAQAAPSAQPAQAAPSAQPTQAAPAAQTTQAAPAAQTVQPAPSAQTYTVQVSQGAKTESGEPGAPMKFTVVQKPGAGSEDVIITLVEDTKAKADPENGPTYSTTAEYDVTTAGSKAVSIR